MIKMNYLNKRMASLGVATALAFTMSSCASSKKQDEENPIKTETTIENVLDDNSNENITNLEVKDNFEEKEIMEESTEPEYVFDPDAPIVVPFESVIMENGEIGYKIPQFYYPYLVDKNYPIPGMSAILESNDEYQILSGCNSINLDGEPIYYSFEGSVGIYAPYWSLLGVDKEQCSEKELQLINKMEYLITETYLMNKVEDSIKQDYFEQAKSNVKK